MSGADDHANFNDDAGTHGGANATADHIEMPDGELELENIGVANGPVSAGDLHQAVTDAYPDATVYVPQYQYPYRLSNAFVVTTDAVFPIGLIEFHGPGVSSWTKYPPMKRGPDEVEDHIDLLAEMDLWIELSVDDEVKGRVRYFLDDFRRSPLTSDLLFAGILAAWVASIGYDALTANDQLAMLTTAVSAFLIGAMVVHHFLVEP